MPVLVVREGSNEGKKLPLNLKKGQLFCGNGDKVTFKLDDPDIAEKHFRLVKNGDELTIYKTDDSAEIEVNGENFEESLSLSVGDTISIGSSVLSIEGEASTGKKKAGTSGKSSAAKGKKKVVLPVAGHTIGGCKLLEQIGEGAGCIVFKAFQEGMDREVVVKVLNEKYASDKAKAEEFALKARVAGQNIHERMIQIYDVGIEKGIAFCVMEYMDGGSLAETLASGEKFSWKVSASVVRDVIDGLFFLNGKGVAHGYVCPENILLDSSGRAKLSHPGISSLFEHEKMGRVHYIAPELYFDDEPTMSGDIYAVGVVLYEMLTGHTPYSGKNIEDIREQQKSGSYAPLEDFVKKPVKACVSLLELMLEADEAQRISGYEEVLLQLPEKSHTTKIVKKGNTDSVADVLTQKGRPSVSAAQRIREKKQLEKEQKHFKTHHIVIGGIVLAIFGVGIWLVTRPDATEEALTRAMALKDGGSFDKAIAVIDNCGWSLRQKYKDKLTEERELLIKLKDGKKVFDSLKKEWEEYILYKRANRDDVSGRRKKVLILKKKCVGNLYAEMKGLHAAIERELHRIKNE